MESITLTPHQQAALDWLVEQVLANLHNQAPTLIALRGLAGTGKTTLIPALRDALTRHHLDVVIGSPTHRAAMILRQKGIVEADTVHAHALTPYFKADYRRAAQWLGDILPVRLDDTETPHDDVEALPYLVWKAVEPDLAKARNVKRQGQRYKAKRLLQSLGINGKDYFNGFGPKLGEGLLIIDEASMIGEKLLQTCQEAFQHIILVGDPGQLPPVKDTAQLATVDGIDLTEIHRQAGDSPIVQLAYKARNGARITANALAAHDPWDLGADAVYALTSAQAAAFLDAPLIVARNDTRVECTHAIRAALGFAKTTLAPGEPLVCRSTSQEDRAIGFYNNGLYRILEVSADDPRLVVVEDALGDTSPIQVHMEELDGEFVDPRAIPFRFGYCLTAHTAQGGEWPIVYISLPDYKKVAWQSHRYGRETELAQWIYTAITRAKTTLCFLTTHHFLRAEEHTMATSKMTPPSAPLLSMDEEAANPALTSLPPGTFPALEAASQPDDIADPATPAAALSPMPHESLVPLVQGFVQFCQSKLDTALIGSTRDAERSIEDMHAYLRRLVEMDHEKVQYAKSALDVMVSKMVTDGVQLHHDPYVAEVQALSPQGYPVKIHVAKADAESLVTALPALIGWLTEQHYKPV